MGVIIYLFIRYGKNLRIKEKVDNPCSCEEACQVGKEGCWDGISGFCDGGEVESDDVEGGFGASNHDGGNASDLGVGSVGLEEVGGDGEGT